MPARRPAYSVLNKTRIKEVTTRDYIDPGQKTVDYVLVFIPNEQVYGFIHEHDSSILDESLKSKVILCSPITLFAILAVVRQAVENFSLQETASQILELLDRDLNSELGESFDLNRQGALELLGLLVEADPDGVGFDFEARESHYTPMADAVLKYRKANGIFNAVDELANVEGLSSSARTYLEDTAAVGAFSLLGAESVGPAVGADLQKKAMLAICFSLVGMLVYIWIRFQLPYAVGAVAALFHDVLITLTAIAVTHREINLPTVAALLTLVGYSVNDTVVVFDRVRENLRLRRGEELEPLMNLSINQTLSRTFITSGTTLVVVVSLYIFGGDVINTFAFVLLVGILVGTYSSIFVASPVALAMNKVLVARRERRRMKGRR